MATRSCPHCGSEIEVDAGIGHCCPACGLDPDLPPLAFEDAPAFFIAGDPRHAVPLPVAVRTRTKPLSG